MDKIEEVFNKYAVYWDEDVKSVTLVDFRKAVAELSQYAPKRTSDEEIENAATEMYNLGIFGAREMGIWMGKYVRGRIFGQDKTEGE